MYVLCTRKIIFIDIYTPFPQKNRDCVLIFCATHFFSRKYDHEAE